MLTAPSKPVIIHAMTKNKRLSPHVRAVELTAVALQLAKTHGLGKLTRDQIAIEAGVAPGLVSLRLGTMPQMRRSIMRAAVAGEVLEVVAEGLAQRPPDQHALAAPESVRRAAAALMAGV